MAPDSAADREAWPVTSFLTSSIIQSMTGMLGRRKMQHRLYLKGYNHQQKA